MARKIDPALIPPHPDLNFENSLWQAGCLNIAGMDEAGRGPLAGPVMAALVILPRQEGLMDVLVGVRDSKQLSFQERSRLEDAIKNLSLAWAVGSASSSEIDQIGIMPATCLAVQRALDRLTILPDHLLVDYIVLPDIDLPQTRLAKGDQRSLTIACASILAKTERDAWMIRASKKYPGYGFEQNKGYGTRKHIKSIQDLGPAPIHRKSFAPLSQMRG